MNFRKSIFTVDYYELVAQASIAEEPKSSIKAGPSAAEREEISRLRRQVRQLQMERDILAKATAWFAAKGEKMFIPSSSVRKL